MSTEIERLRAAMWKYGKHLVACRLQKDMTSWCDCGWTQVRETLAGEAERQPVETSECSHCREVYEIWAGSDGFVPQTAAEGYQERLILQMRDAAKGGLSVKASEPPAGLDCQTCHGEGRVPLHQPGSYRMGSEPCPDCANPEKTTAVRENRCPHGVSALNRCDKCD